MNARSSVSSPSFSRLRPGWGASCGARLLGLMVCTLAPTWTYATPAPGGQAGAEAEHRPPPLTGGRALPPSVGALLENAFARMGPQLTLNSASIQGDHVDAEICEDVAAKRGCHRLTLSDPKTGCAGAVVGAWCLVWSSAPPAAALLERARSALATDPEAKVWLSVSTEPPEARQEDDATPPVGMALLVILAALLAGGLLVWLGSRVKDGRLRAALWCAIVLLPWAGLWPPGGEHPGLGAWDWLVFALLWDASAGLTLAWTLVGGGKLTAALLAGAALAAVGIGEVVSSSDGEKDDVSSAPIHWHAESTDRRACQLIFTQSEIEKDGPFATAHNQPRPVVHFGSGLLYGEGWSARDELRRNLEQHSPGSRHVIAGLGRGATDFQLLALRALLPAHPVEAVVLHLAAEKDVAEMDTAVACCEAGPLLDYAEAVTATSAPAELSPTTSPEEATATLPPMVAKARCHTPRWRQTTRLYLASSPPPLVLQALADRSDLARRAARGIDRLARRLRPRTATWGRDPEVTWRHFEAAVAGIRRTLAEAGIPLVVVLLPYPDALAAPKPGDTQWHGHHQRLRDLLQRQDVAFIDAWLHFEQRSKAGSKGILRGHKGAGWELTGPGRGAFVRWLALELAGRLRPSGGAAPDAP